MHVFNPNIDENVVYKCIASVLRSGGVIAYPTDSGYVFGCGNKSRSAINRIIKIKKLSNDYKFTRIFDSVDRISKYADVSKDLKNVLKIIMPSPFTFILSCPLNNELNMPTIGVRIPDNKIATSIVSTFGDPLISTSIVSSGESINISSPCEIYKEFHDQIDVLVDGGICKAFSMTVINLTSGIPVLERLGEGNPDKVFQIFKVNKIQLASNSQVNSFSSIMNKLQKGKKDDEFF